MLDAKKVRLSLALLLGRVVLLVEIGGVTSTPESIDTQPNTEEQNKSHEDKVQCTIVITCQIYAMMSSYEFS